MLVAVVRPPQFSRSGVDGHADDISHTRCENSTPGTVEVELQNRTAFQTLGATHIARPADTQIHLAARFIDHQGACGVPPAGGDVADEDLPFLIDAVVILIAITKDARTVPDIEIALEELERLGPFEVCRHHDRFIRYTVSIAIRQCQDLIGVHVGHMQNAVVIEGHEARTIEGFKSRVDTGAESRGQVEGQILG